jgi:uncharacterized protein (DUF1697 family)
MTTYVGVLRAINLGPYNRIAMSDLRAMLEKLGFGDPKTLLQSGNIIFKSDSRSGASLEQQLEAASTRVLRVTTDYFVRSAKEWQEIVDGNPFKKEAAREPGRLLMMCLRDAPLPAQVKALQASISGGELVKTRGRHAYFVYPDGIGRSKLTIQKIEKTLGTRGTGRNWNTVLKLAELSQ